ncbi:MAG: response regulator [Bacteroidota bacterium]
MRIIYYIVGLLIFISYQNTLTASNPSEFYQINIEDISGSGYELKGNYTYYHNRLLSESSSSKTSPAVVITDQLLSNQGYDHFSFGTLTCTLKVPAKQGLALQIPDMYSAYRLYINDELVATKGQVGTNKESSKASRNKKLIPIYSTSDTLRLAIELSNFSHVKYGFNKPIKIGYYEQLQQSKLITVAYDLFLTGSLAIGGFFFLGLYYFGRKSNLGLYFALFCITYSYRIISWENFVLNELIPSYPWWISIRVEYISLYLSAVFFIKYSTKLFKDESLPFIANSFKNLSLLFTVSTILLPVDWFTRFSMIFIIILLSMILYIIYIYIIAAIHKRAYSTYSLLSLTGITTVFILKSLAYFDLIEEPIVLTGIGQLLFFFFQAIILSKVFAMEWIMAKEHAEQLSKAKSEFMSMISHEIKTPLNAILGTAYHLIEDKPKKTHEKDLQYLKNSTENLSVLVDNILDYSKLSAGEIALNHEKVDFVKYMNKILSPYRERALNKNLLFIVNFDPLIPRWMLVDKIKLSNVFCHLLDNALKFTESGEVRINVVVRNKKGDQVQLLFGIQDTGIGIEENMLSQIFNVFVQANQSESRKHHGTGLGLSMTKHLLKLMGSELKVNSQPGKGSDFHFELNLKMIDDPGLAEKYTDNLTDLTNQEVLLVEDNEINAMIAKRLLKKWGIKVTHAWNGLECLNKCKDKRFDIILMDLQMPEMDGYEASAKLRERNCETPIIALTASTKEKAGDQLHEAGMNDLVSKPYTPEMLHHIICKYIQAKHTVAY